MPKQNIRQRIERILKDASEKPETGEGAIDLDARWAKIAEDPDVPGLGYVLAKCGQMPVATLDDVDRSVAVLYAARDADVTLRIHQPMREIIEELELETVETIDLAVIPMVERMQTNGIKVNVPHLVKLGDEMLGLMRGEVAAIKKITGREINPNSGDQVAALIFDELGLAGRYKTKGGTRYSTDDKTLEGLRSAHPVMPHILDYRGYEKTRDSFCIVLPRKVGRDGRIRGNMRITRVVTGRLSMADPNLMAIPVRSDLGKRIREAFIAEDGCVLGTVDLDQIEMRMMAHRSGCPTLTGLFIRGDDIHAITASQMFGIPVSQVHPMKHRYPAKRVGFGVITGITGKGLREQMDLAGTSIEGCTTDEDYDRVIAEWFKIYPAVLDYMEDRRAEARRYGMVRDMWGRIRYLPGIYDPRKWVREEAERQSHSHDIQGSAQGIMKLGMAAVWNEVLPMYWRQEMHAEPLLQVHDELLNELGVKHAKFALDEMKAAMCGAVKLSVPIKAKSAIGPNWGALEK